MKYIINQIYWDDISNTYMAGTSFKKKDNEKVVFRNTLMPAGKTIVKWTSNNNYQVSKEVPSLPILQNGKKYQIKSTLAFEPANTIIFCLRFFDLQSNEIKKKVFSDLETTFIYPPNAVSYTFEIINGGCSKIEFSKFQIASIDLPDNLMDDFVLLPLTNNDYYERVKLILVSDSKRVREVLKKATLSEESQVYLAYVSWQEQKKINVFLEQALKRFGKKEIDIFNTNQKISKNLHEIKIENPNYIVKNIDFDKNMQSKWLTKDTIRINQVSLIKWNEKCFKD